MTPLEKQQLVLSVDSICKSEAGRYAEPHLAYDDALGVARLAACEAADRYVSTGDLTASWRAYARVTIRTAVREALRRARIVRLPRSAEERGEPLCASVPLQEAREPFTSFVDARLEVAELLEDLPERERTAFVAVTEGWTYEELGTHLGVTKQRAHQLYTKALDALRRKASRGKRAHD
jgi:RNA polymerase sigma factor (sigma-70 family)